MQEGYFEYLYSMLWMALSASDNTHPGNTTTELVSMPVFKIEQNSEDDGWVESQKTEVHKSKKHEIDLESMYLDLLF